MSYVRGSNPSHSFHLQLTTFKYIQLFPSPLVLSCIPCFPPIFPSRSIPLSPAHSLTRSILFFSNISRSISLLSSSFPFPPLVFSRRFLPPDPSDSFKLKHFRFLVGPISLPFCQMYFTFVHNSIFVDIQIAVLE